MDSIGFMQGRLSPQVGNRIQAFPFLDWEYEFSEAKNLGISIMEWTIDSVDFDLNPLISVEGYEKIRNLSRSNSVAIPSVTCDYFMENPFWDSNGYDTESDLIKIIRGMNRIDSRILVIPLVDNSSLSNYPSTEDVINNFRKLELSIREKKVSIAFEVDLSPEKASDFISEFPIDCFGINYDIGNSASLGFNPNDEFDCYGHRIINIHVKDRYHKGTTVKLGDGAADFPAIARNLLKREYGGNFIFQTARSAIGKHAEELMTNIVYFMNVMKENKIG
jgi:hexulose-6-phosphate isomerase